MEEKSSKIYKYDSSYFSKKMQEVDKKGKLSIEDTRMQFQQNYESS